MERREKLIATKDLRNISKTLKVLTKLKMQKKVLDDTIEQLEIHLKTMKTTNKMVYSNRYHPADLYKGKGRKKRK